MLRSLVRFGLTLLLAVIAGLGLFFASAQSAGPLATTITAKGSPPATTVTAEDATPAAAALPVAKLLTQAQAWYDQRETAGTIEEAIALYKKVLAQDPNHYEALWRLARCYWWHGDHSPRNQQVDIYGAGELIGKRAAEANPQAVDGFYWWGVCQGRASEVRGIFNSLFAVDPIRKSMERVLELDPEHGLAHHVLGVLYRKAPGWPLSCGDGNKSLTYARQAVEYAPDNVLPYVGLAKTLIAKGEKEEAKTLLKKTLELPGPPDKQPETKKDQETARKLLEKLNI